MTIYRLSGSTESIFVLTGELSSLPTECPNDSGHSIDTNRTVIVSTQEIEKPLITSKNFNRGSAHYHSTRSTLFRVIQQFKYVGCDTRELLQLTLVLSVDSNETGAFQLTDNTNGKIIVSSTNWSTGTIYEPITVVISTFNNVPNNPAILELAIKKVSGFRDVNIHSMSLK